MSCQLKPFLGGIKISAMSVVITTVSFISGYVTLGSPFSADEQATGPRDPGFHGYLSRVNIWGRALDVSVEIPIQVRSCKNAPELFNGMLLRWSGYDK